MAENAKSDHQNRFSTKQESESRPYELRFDTSNGENNSNSACETASMFGDGEPNDFCGKSDSRGFGAVGSNAARYKLMSPARLPISRSPCLTIPPGLSPTSLLDSPVLLSNMKAEPSPTTGTFHKPQIMHDTGASDSLCSPRDKSNTSAYNERSCNGFEFKPHIRSSLSSGLSSMGHMASTGLDNQQSESFGQIEGQYQTQTFVSSSSAKIENVAASHELTLSVATPNQPLYAVSSRSSAPAEVAKYELWQKPGLDSGVQAIQSDHRGAGSLTTADRSLEDGYNWRKYGQKHVKGCEFPRSYYKCTHPNCQVKKQLERSHDGQITEITYKGSHDHPKPQPNRRTAVGTVPSAQEEGSDRLSPLNSSEDKSSNLHLLTYNQNEPNGDLSPVTAGNENVEGTDAPSNRVINEVEDDEDEDDPESKRRKKDICGVDVTLMGKVTREPRVVVQTLSEVDILDDGYRWRKYGQKVVKGNPNPRSYYKCTNAGCPVRKHVERASHDPKAVITTYEGKHNHDVPAAKSSAHDSAGPAVYNTAMNGMLRTRSEDIDTISLDLGVGMNSSPENRSNDRHQILDVKPLYMADPGCSKMIQTYCGGLGDSNDQYGSREGRVESFSFETRPLSHSSNPYQHNMGRLMMGP